jgi:hypothetical protein
VRPETLSHYDIYGPFTSHDPFDASKLLPDNTATLLDIVQDLVPQTELDDNNEEYNADQVENTFKRIDIKDAKYWMFADTGHLLTYHRGQNPVTDDYTGKRYFNNQLMDAGVLPEIYIDYLT